MRFIRKAERETRASLWVAAKRIGPNSRVHGGEQGDNLALRTAEAEKAAENFLTIDPHEPNNEFGLRDCTRSWAETTFSF